MTANAAAGAAGQLVENLIDRKAWHEGLLSESITEGLAAPLFAGKRGDVFKQLGPRIEDAGTQVAKKILGKEYVGKAASLGKNTLRALGNYLVEKAAKDYLISPAVKSALDGSLFKVQVAHASSESSETLVGLVRAVHTRDIVRSSVPAPRPSVKPYRN